LLVWVLDTLRVFYHHNAGVSLIQVILEEYALRQVAEISCADAGALAG